MRSPIRYPSIQRSKPRPLKWPAFVRTLPPANSRCRWKSRSLEVIVSVLPSPILLKAAGQFLSTHHLGSDQLGLAGLASSAPLGSEGPALNRNTDLLHLRRSCLSRLLVHALTDSCFDCPPLGPIRHSSATHNSS